MTYQQILGRLIEARKVAGLSQGQVGVLIGMSTSGFSDIERGKNPLYVERLLQLIDIYGVSVEWVMTGVNPHFDPQFLIEKLGEAHKDLDVLMQHFSMIGGNK